VKTKLLTAATPRTLIHRLKYTLCGLAGIIEHRYHNCVHVHQHLVNLHRTSQESRGTNVGIARYNRGEKLFHIGQVNCGDHCAFLTATSRSGHTSKEQSKNRTALEDLQTPGNPHYNLALKSFPKIQLPIYTAKSTRVLRNTLKFHFIGGSDYRWETASHSRSKFREDNACATSSSRAAPYRHFGQNWKVVPLQVDTRNSPPRSPPSSTRECREFNPSTFVSP
jgi:hypothetical protein